MDNAINVVSLTNKSLWAYRISGFLAGILIIIIPYLIPPEGVTDPIWLRYVIGGLVLSCCGGSLLIAVIKKYFIFVFYGLVFLITIWLTWLAFINNLRLDYSPTVIVSLLVSGVTFKHPRWLWAYLLGVFIFSILVFSLPDAPVVNPYFFMMIELIALVGLGLLMQGLLGERQKMKVRQRRQQAITLSAFEYSDHGILVLDLQGKVLDKNPRFLEIWQVEERKLEHNLLPLDAMLAQVKDVEAFAQLIQESENKPEQDFSQTFQMKDGRYFDRFGKPLKLEEQPIGRIWFFEEATERMKERKRAERKRELLEGENSALTQLASAARDPNYDQNEAVRQIANKGIELLQAEEASIWMFSRKTQTLRCVLGIGGKEIEGWTGQKINIAALGNTLDLLKEVRVLHANGDQNPAPFSSLTPIMPQFAERPALLVPLRLSGRLRGMVALQRKEGIFEWTDEEIGFAASLGDIGGMLMESIGRKMSEKALKSTLEQMRSIVNSVPDLLLRMDLKGNILDLKIPESNEYQEFPRTEVNLLSQLLPEQIADEILLLSQRSVLDNTLGMLEKEIEMGGEERDLEIRTAKTGEEEALVIIRDVTAQKTVERELIRRNFELDSFVYRASHDLKAPLNSLMGLIHIIEEEEISHAIQEYLKLMNRSVNKLNTFILKLTEFSRITRLELERNEIDFEQVIQEVFESLQYMEDNDRVRKEVELVGEHLYFGDRFHLEIVLGNLLSNAIKYQDYRKEDSYVKVKVELSTETVIIDIEDNGIGIPEQHQDRLFELFFRASNQSFGSGLGLYIIRNTVEKLGGTIGLKSTQGQGTTFQLSLPNIKNKTAPDEAASIYKPKLSEIVDS